MLKTAVLVPLSSVCLGLSEPRESSCGLHPDSSRNVGSRQHAVLRQTSPGRVHPGMNTQKVSHWYKCVPINSVSSVLFIVRGLRQNDSGQILHSNVHSLNHIYLRNEKEKRKYLGVCPTTLVSGFEIVKRVVFIIAASALSLDQREAYISQIKLL